MFMTEFSTMSTKVTSMNIAFLYYIREGLELCRRLTTSHVKRFWAILNMSTIYVLSRFTSMARLVN